MISRASMRAKGVKPGWRKKLINIKDAEVISQDLTYYGTIIWKADHTNIREEVRSAFTIILFVLVLIGIRVGIFSFS